jgi:glyceraldehyde 3-phosphate dehydrogenase
MAIKVGINGFGRIGRCLVRACLADPKITEVEFVAINDLTDPQTLAYLLKYDSVFGTLREQITVEPGGIVAGPHRMRVFSEQDPAGIDWTSCGADIVVESTGVFTDAKAAGKHLGATVKKVIITAPAKHEDITIVLGVNEGMYDPKTHSVISNASCTTNCLGPLVKVLHDAFHIQKGWMTTIHSYTNDQNVLDFPHKDLRRSRAAAINIIPTKTGAAEALGLVIPDLKGKFSGAAMRVPTPDVSVVDLVTIVSKTTTAVEVNAALKAAATGSLKYVLEYTDDPIVSADLRQNPHSAIVDGGCTRVLDGNLVRTVAWYDNEWGYSNRIVDLIRFITSQDAAFERAEVVHEDVVLQSV